MSENHTTVAFLGPAGTFSQAAAIQHFGDGCELHPCATIDDVFAAVANGSADYGVVPVENSTEGPVNNTQDCLVDSDVQIVGEEIVPIEHNLLVPKGAENMAINVIASHKQSLAQCRGWIQQHYPDAELLECTSNADAANRVSAEAGVAAIAGAMAASTYKLHVLAERIQDQDHNRTRFLVLHQAPVAASGADKTSILVYAENKPGALFRVLEPFEKLQISLTKIDSRPSKNEAWAYVFFIDFEGHVEDDSVKQLLSRLRGCTEEVKVLGSYPAFAEARSNAAGRALSAPVAGPGLQSQTVCIVGLGMIGGSIARGLRRAMPELAINAVDHDADALAAARADGTLDAAGTVEEILPSADLVILAVPPLTLPDFMQQLQVHSKPNAVFTDVGSVKSHIIEALKDCPDEFCARFVPGHPIAGSERSGYHAANPELFENRRVILTPHPGSAAAAVTEVHRLWRALGAEVLGMSPGRHDDVLAATSHLPHLLAYAIVDLLLHQDASEDIFRYAAGGFADFSRVASSSAQMWSDVFVANASATEKVLDQYIEYLQGLKQLIHERARDDMKTIFQRAKQTRDNFVLRLFDPEQAMAMNNQPTSYRITPGGSVNGSIRVPGDKSISHRSVIFGALSKGVTKVSGFLEGEDAMNTVAAFREMGVTISGPENGELTIYGVGMQGLQPPRKPLYMGNSGTAMRLLAGLLAAQPFDSELTGDESLSARPMARIVNPLTEMGASIEMSEAGTPPLRISGADLVGLSYDMPVASAQVKSSLLLAGLFAEGKTEISEPAICRDHTERMLRGFGYELEGGYPDAVVTLFGGGSLQADSIDVPADISSAAFFLVAAAITPGSELSLRHVGINPTRTGILELLRQMGAQIEVSNESEVGGEPVADLTVRYAPLHGIEIDPALVPLAIDEFPVLFVAAAYADGRTVLRGAEELRVKESDRIDAMAEGLRTLGVELETFADGISIEGGGVLGGGTIDSRGDHRIAMAFAVAGLQAKAEIEILNCQNVATSFPGFVSQANEVGLQVSEISA